MHTSSGGWNLADMFDAVAGVVPPARQAIVHDGGVVSWGELDARSNRLARGLIGAGHLPGERVAFLSRNHPGYIEGFIACLKARLIHVNINYRYTVDEIAGVLEDAGCTAILYHAEFAPQVAQLQQRPGTLRSRVCMGGAAGAEGTASLDVLATTGDAGRLEIQLSDDDSLLLPGRSFDPHAVWQLAEREGASRILIVGDVFARPLLRALDEHPGRYRLDSVRIISSAGLMWSQEVKEGLFRHMPHVVLADICGASEASGLGYAIATRDNILPTGCFHAGPHTVLLDGNDQVLPPDLPAEGWLARAGPLPEGYFGDARKTAEVFRTIDGVRYSVPGDWARRNADGTLQLLGRGSLVINSGGEKVFVEEVEEALKLWPQIDDAMVLGLPDERWGNRITALVTLRGPSPLDADALRAAMAGQLAAYKMPRHIWCVDELPRADSGKGDYRAARGIATALLAHAVSTTTP